MPWNSMSDVPNDVKELNGVNLTLDQANFVSQVADALDGTKNAWPTAINIFKCGHSIHDGKWVERTSGEEADEIFISKEADGSYWITTVSTAALPDREKETFTAECIDYDLKEAEATSQYPEFRLFHKAALGIGKVVKMSRVGIFAVDEGPSYKDPFSLSVCENVLAKNDGTWRVSRGFIVKEVSGDCPVCNSSLMVTLKHLVAGFSCPTCKAVHLTYKQVLDNVRFLKARTFDVTITDKPCNPYTAASAVKLLEAQSMTKEELKQRLLKAGVDSAAIDEKLKSVSDAQLKELGTDLPDAILLKEFEQEEAETEEGGVFTLDPGCLADFAKIAKEAVHDEVLAQLSELEIEIPDVGLKEVPGIAELKELLESVNTKLDALLKTDTQRTKELLEDTPRSGKLRIRRYKATAAADDGDDPDLEDMTDQEMEAMMKKKKLMAHKDVEEDDGVVIAADNGQQFKSLTEMMLAGGDD